MVEPDGISRPAFLFGSAASPRSAYLRKLSLLCPYLIYSLAANPVFLKLIHDRERLADRELGAQCHATKPKLDLN
jgi:hypothetical protein